MRSSDHGPQQPSSNAWESIRQTQNLLLPPLLITVPDHSQTHRQKYSLVSSGFGSYLVSKCPKHQLTSEKSWRCIFSLFALTSLFWRVPNLLTTAMRTVFVFSFSASQKFVLQVHRFSITASHAVSIKRCFFSFTTITPMPSQKMLVLTKAPSSTTWRYEGFQIRFRSHTTWFTILDSRTTKT